MSCDSEPCFEGRAACARRRRPGARFRLILEDEIEIVGADEAVAAAVEYRQGMIERYWPLVRRYWFHALVVVAAGEAVIELVVRRNEKGAPASSLWILIPLVAVGILPLLTWRRFRFGTPAAVFVIGAVSSFVDGRLV